MGRGNRRIWKNEERMMKGNEEETKRKRRGNEEETKRKRRGNEEETKRKRVEDLGTYAKLRQWP